MIGAALRRSELWARHGPSAPRILAMQMSVRGFQSVTGGIEK
jgi:hypothetical protein